MRITYPPLAFLCLGLCLCSARAVHAQSLPSPWSSRDVGAPALAGSASYSSGIYTIRAAGADIWGTSDQFHFVYQTLSGDGEIVARVASLINTNGWAKAGVMMRESLTAESRHAFAMISATNGAAFQHRTATGGLTAHVGGTIGLPPRWLRLTRRASTFSAFESTDGATWRAIGSSTISMASTLYIGIAVTSHRTTLLTTATASNVRVTTTGANALPTVALTSPPAGSSFVAPASITLQASASDSDGIVSRVEFFSGATLVGTSTASPYTLTWNNVPAGTYSITAVATDNAGGRTTSAALSITVTAVSGPVPAPWTSEDIGTPAIRGDATESGGTFTIRAGGADIWGTADQFHFVHQLLTGDGEIVARVQSLAAVNTWSKAGVMMRESLAAGSKHASMFATGSAGMAFQRRTSTGSTSLHTAGSAVRAPFWVRLVRRGDIFEAYEAADGAAWRMVGSASIPMLQTIYVGLAVTSHDSTTATTAAISDVTVTDGGAGNQPPVISLTAPANGAAYTAPATVMLSATANDVDGTVSRVDFYRSGILIASDATSPYSATWSNAPAGTYSLTAVATDNSGSTMTSAPVTIRVDGPINQLPTVALTSPVTGASFSAPTTVALIATAGDADGSIARVDFYAGSTLIASDATSPYSVTWINARPGTYSITAAATDNSGGRTSSAPVTVTLRPAEAVFAASADHNTLVTSYRLDIFVAGADPVTAMPLATRDLGKPTPVNGDITVDITATLEPLAAGTYFATVSAIGSSGASRSAPSAEFVR